MYNRHAAQLKVRESRARLAECADACYDATNARDVATRRGRCAIMDIKSPAVGKVLRLSASADAKLARGDEIMVIESMKVEIPIKAPADGRLRELRVAPGEHIRRGAVLAILDE